MMSYMSTQCPKDVPRKSEVDNLGLQSCHVVEVKCQVGGVVML